MEHVRRVVAAVLYLCSAEADVIDPDRPRRCHDGPWRPARPQGVWDVGYRLATALPRARSEAADDRGAPTPAPGPTCAGPLAPLLDRAEGLDPASLGAALAPTYPGGR